MNTNDWINVIMGVLTFGLGIIIALVANIFKDAIADLKDCIKKIEEGMKEREERNFTEHKELYGLIGGLEKTTTEVGAIQGRCKVCSGNYTLKGDHK